MSNLKRKVKIFYWDHEGVIVGFVLALAILVIVFLGAVTIGVIQ